MTWVERLKLFRLLRSVRKEPDCPAFKQILRKNYMQILDDVQSGADYTIEANMDSDLIRRALIIREAMDSGLSYDLLLNPHMDAGQLEVGLSALQEGLSREQITTFFHPDYHHAQMEQLKIGLTQLPKEKIDFFKSPRFNARQMVEIREALVDHLPDSIIKLIANTHVHDASMHEMRVSAANGEKPVAIKKLAAKLQFANTYLMRQGLERGMEVATIHGIVEHMCSLHAYWDKAQFKQLVKEICTEISQNKIVDLNAYFADKFIQEPEPEQESEPQPEPETKAVIDPQAEQKPDEPVWESTASERFDIQAEDELLQKKEQEQQHDAESPAIVETTVEAAAPHLEPEVAIMF